MLDHGPNPAAKPPVLCILGPTASGKSRLAFAVATRAGGEIVSVDALKVYRGMDAGTAKPSAADRARVPHHGLDLVEPHEEFSVARFLDWVEPVLKQVVSRGNLPILDVTAPYYLKALVYGIERGPGPQPAFRAEMEARPLPDLHAELGTLDAEAAKRIGPADRKRMIRALEIARFSDRRPSEAAKWAQPRADYRWVFTGISWPRETLYARVEARARAMFAAGWLEEVRRIRAGTGFSKTAGMAHGYRRLQQFIDGAITHDEAVALSIRDVRQFARKSMTFFRGFPKVQWLEVQAEEEIDRAAMYLSQEMKQLMAECGMARPPIDLPGREG